MEIRFFPALFFFWYSSWVNLLDKYWILNEILHTLENNFLSSDKISFSGNDKSSYGQEGKFNRNGFL